MKVAKKKYLKCFSSERASTYVEFAMITPLFLVIVSFLIEICLFYDACVMANHTAFTVGRIAKVHLQLEKNKKPPIFLMQQKFKVEMPKGAGGMLKTLIPGIDKSENVVTALLMSTCTFSLFKSGSTFSADEHKFIKDTVANLLISCIPKIPRVDSGVLKFFSSPINSLVDKLNNKVGEIIKSFVNSNIIGGAIEQFAKLIGKNFSRVANRCYNASKIVQKGDVISITPFGGKLILHYPWHVHSDKIKQNFFDRMLRRERHGLSYFGTSLSNSLLISIDYPLGNNWIFPFFLSARLQKPRAVGRALIFPEPIFDSKHLKGNNMERPDDQVKHEKIPKKYQKKSSLDIEKFIEIRRKYAHKFSNVKFTLDDLRNRFWDHYREDRYSKDQYRGWFRRKWNDLVYLKEHQAEAKAILKKPSVYMLAKLKKIAEKMAADNKEHVKEKEKLEKELITLKARLAITPAGIDIVDSDGTIIDDDEGYGYDNPEYYKLKSEIGEIERKINVLNDKIEEFDSYGELDSDVLYEKLSKKLPKDYDPISTMYDGRRLRLLKELSEYEDIGDLGVEI